MQGTHEAVDSLDEKASVAGFEDMLEGLSHVIHKISCEVGFNARIEQCSSFSINNFFLF